MIHFLVFLGTPFTSMLGLIYGDPGTGMFLWQLATAAAIGVLFYAKTIFRRVRLLVKSERADQPDPATSDHS